VIEVTNRRPVPLGDEHSQRYWEAAARGQLLIQRCTRCGTHQFYPRRHCAACLAPDPEWIVASGRGRLSSYSVVSRATNPEFAEDCPYVFAIVELEEGPRVSTRIVGAPHSRLRCEAPVTLCAPTAAVGQGLLCFELDGA
jgi:uncharacterized OB-fold protein